MIFLKKVRSFPQERLLFALKRLMFINLFVNARVITLGQAEGFPQAHLYATAAKN